MRRQPTANASIADDVKGNFLAFGIRVRHDFFVEQYCDDASQRPHAFWTEAQPIDGVASAIMYAVHSVASMPWESFGPIAARIVKHDSDDEEWVVA